MRQQKWFILSACHAGLLADHRTPVGSFAADLYFYIDHDLYFMQVIGRTTDSKEQN
jgi:hypothetical protein